MFLEIICKIQNIGYSICLFGRMLIKQGIKAKKNILTKSSQLDLVTETDKKVEEALISHLHEHFPTHKFIGEESSYCEKELTLTDDPTWIIDPVDGTMNFVHGNPNTCISLALYIKKEPTIAIIYAPVLGDLYSSISGEGAFLNGEPIKVSMEKDLAKSLIIMECGSNSSPEKMTCVKQNFDAVYHASHGIRMYGSAALNIASVARGSADAYFEFGLHIWDMAAGYLIVKEAGGFVQDPNGGDLDLMSCRFMCASTMEVAQDLTKIIKQYYPKRDDQ
ncbi:inositol monophosphatase 1-like isoform X2 [Cimex lectularius]|uniref:Inositol-1-monophosphatase n=1 Tax=Cimex lectularius TaxID=79782 RepID=A0A8I6RTM9_CIMLE|nr:inositol monophosphatase 1-like isoform X2 [Cimex lectularius]